MLKNIAAKLLFLQIVMLMGWILFAGVYFSSPSDDPQSADLIVVLGGGTGERLAKGAELYSNGYAGNVLVTGYRMEDSVLTQWHGGWRSAYLEERGVDSGKIIVNTDVTSTYDEAMTVKQLMLDNGWHKALIVSDPPHLRRISWIFGRAFENSGMEFSTIAAQGEWWDSWRWWKDAGAIGFVITETIKMLFYIYEYGNPNTTGTD